MLSIFKALALKNLKETAEDIGQEQYADIWRRRKLEFGELCGKARVGIADTSSLGLTQAACKILHASLV